MNIKLVSDKYRPVYAYTDTQNGVKVLTTNPDGAINSRLITDNEFNEQLAQHLKNGYIIEVRDEN